MSFDDTLLWQQNNIMMWSRNSTIVFISNLLLQQGLEIRGFWGQKKTVQLKTALREVYTYVLKGIFFQKTVQLQGFSVSQGYCYVVWCTIKATQY